MGAFGGPDIVKSGLVLYLDAANTKSYPTTGTAWSDLSGNNTNGTLTNGPTFSSENGGSIVLDGVNDFVRYTSPNPFAETIIVWMRSKTSTWNKDGYISSARTSNGHIIHPDVNTKQVSFYVLNSNQTNIGFGSTVLTDITIPHMYVITTNGSNLHSAYIDGNLVGTSTTSATRTTNPSNTNTELGFDTGVAGRYGNANFYMTLRYNRALSAAEIQQNYNATKTRFGL